MTSQYVPVDLPGPPNQPPVHGLVQESPESRAWLETLAIPGCKPWREAHLEPMTLSGDLSDGREPTMAPYCCSAYCQRCAGLRALDRVEPLRPNEWMHEEDK